MHEVYFRYIIILDQSYYRQSTFVKIVKILSKLESSLNRTFCFVPDAGRFRWILLHIGLV